VHTAGPAARVVLAPCPHAGVPADWTGVRRVLNPLCIMSMNLSLRAFAVVPAASLCATGFNC